MKKLFSYKGGDPVEVKDFKEVQKFVAKEHGVNKKQVAIHPIVFEDEEFSRGVVLLTKLFIYKNILLFFFRLKVYTTN